MRVLAPWRKRKRSPHPITTTTSSSCGFVWGRPTPLTLLATLASAQCRLLFACSYIRRFKKKKKKKEFDDEDDEEEEDVVRPLLQDICKTVRRTARRQRDAHA